MRKRKLIISLFLFTLIFSGVFFGALNNARAALPAPGNEMAPESLAEESIAAKTNEANSASSNFSPADSQPTVLGDNNQKNSTTPIKTTSEKLPVYFFWGDGCPHCEKEKQFLAGIKDDYPQIQFLSIETWNNKANYDLLMALTEEKTGRASGAVPVIIIGDEVVLGFNTAQTTGKQIEHLLNVYSLTGNCNTDEENQEECEIPANGGDDVDVPIFGLIDTKAVSLPILTAILGLVDGFNPCSMWALVILITLLINTGSRKKIWIVGWTFILVSALSYFIFLTAWLNTFLLIGYIKWVRLGIGLLALVIGIYLLRDYWKKRKQTNVVCEVTSDKTKEKIITHLQNTLQKNSLWGMVIGVAVIAFSVNLIELMCSAGIPAIYTQVLSQNELPRPSYYLYLLFYDFFYMLDHIVVLLIAGFTWQMFMGLNKYAKFSHLIGGILILILGIIMIFSPNLLMFG